MKDDNGSNKNRSIYHRRAMLMITIIGVGIVLFFIILQYILRIEAIREQDENNNRFFASTISNLINNNDEVDALADYYDKNNIIMLNNLVKAYSNDNYRKLEAMPSIARSELLANSTATMEDCEVLLVVNRQGDIIVSSYPNENGENILTDDVIDISEKEFLDLCDGRDSRIPISNPYFNEEEVTGDLLYMYCKMIPGSYGPDGNKYIMLGFSSDIIDKAAYRMFDLSAWLNVTTIGNNGFALVVDSVENSLQYGKINDIDVTDATPESLGIDDEILKNGFKGRKKINGIDCYVSSKEFSTELYGKDDYIIACIPIADLYVGNFPVILWNLSLLFIFLVLLTAYASFVRSEMLRSNEDQLRVRLFKYKGTPIYFSRTLGKKIIPIVIVSALLVFLSAMYIQSLMKLSGAFSESVSIEEEISADIEESINLKNDFLDYYDMQSVSRAKLIAFIVALQGDEYFDFSKESASVMALGNSDGSGNRDVIRDDYNNAVNVINNSKALDKLKEANEVENIYLISDAGYTIATSSDYWSFSLSSKEDAQSYEFWDIINGRRDTIVQRPMISDEGRMSQFIGCTLNYYTRLDDNGNTEYVKYTDYLQQLNDDYTGNEITRHRGLLQIELDPDEEANMVESATPVYILSNTKISDDGFLIGFEPDTDIALYPGSDLNKDSEKETYRVFYSGIESMVGKSADDLGISDNAFTGYYNGFQNVNGRRYLQSFRQVDRYYIATAIPTDKLYYSSFMTAVFCAVFGLILMLILSMFTLLVHDMDAEELYREEHDPLAVFGHWDTSKEWQKSTNTQKFELLIKKALLFGGAVFLAAIAYEAYRFGSNSAILYILNGGWDTGINIFSLSAVFLTVIISGLVIKAFEHIIYLIAEAFGSRVETMMHLFTSLIKAAAIVFVLFYCLYLLGIQATRLLASAGILSIVVGLGAQSLVSDLLAGIFIVMEGSLHVGDYILVDGVRGKVIEIGLRTTRYEDDNQNIRIICNNALKEFANMSMKYSIVFYNIPVPYKEDYPRIRSILNKEFLQLYEDNRFLKGIPVCQGIQNFADSSVDLRIKFMCDEAERYDVQWFMYDNIMRIFMANNITVPFNQMDVHYEVIRAVNEEEAIRN